MGCADECKQSCFIRAAQAALEAAGENKRGVAIHLEKRIPAQAGLGGGSSDAAAALTGVNRLLGLGLEEKKRYELAAALGSDVPFFLMGGAASARGRGEILTSLPDIEPFWLVVVKPTSAFQRGGRMGSWTRNRNAPRIGRPNDSKKRCGRMTATA